MNNKHRVAGIETMAEYIGAAAAVALVRDFGGLSIKIPKRHAGSVWAQLTACMGEPSARDLVDAFGGEGLYIARNAAEEREQRRAQIAELLAKGNSYTQIARSLTITTRYTERGIRRLMACTGHTQNRARSAGNPNQMGLRYTDGSAALPAPGTLEGVWGSIATKQADSVPADS